MMWIAKNKDTGFEYPKKFNDIMDCQAYIDKELKEDLLKAKEDFVLGYMRSHKGAAICNLVNFLRNPNNKRKEMD